MCRGVALRAARPGWPPVPDLAGTHGTMFSGLLGACTPQACSSCQPKAPAERVAAAGWTSPAESPFTLHAETQAPRVPRQDDGRTKRLSVPPIFTRFQFSVIYTQLGATQGTLMEQQKAMLQAILKHFTKELQRGVVLPVVDQDGRMLHYSCRLDSTMTQITMQLDDPGTAKVLVLRDVERICSPEEVRNLRAANPLFIDECCTTVVLTGQRFVTFRLESIAAREYLMLGLQVLRMSQDRARMWYT